ncbi:MAG: hypothetical protein QOJ81_1924 [Chloroflexota bacterium]|jgi:hypothetical protein|nr:hypothetical protein [Chloroflexota bacterium]
MDPWRDDPIENDDTDRRRDEPEVVPAVSAEQPFVAAGIGVDAYVGRSEESDGDNDQESHVSPADNDGETVPRDEVVDQVGG